ncbi:MAG: riboflavin kinase/FMN adenylyltransferase [Fusobacteria bacterium]|nr:MAG: riboflavin kinase/FMN adenylyltransferase [Fusobacteriota bacterium]KAF0229677.1 MAG: riboflavin kinase/FMN [Fusobacteriota bacterium]
MVIFNGIDKFNLKGEITAILGNFDGLHLGHLELIKSGFCLGGKVVIITFEPHPISMKHATFKRLQTFKEKLAYFENLGVDGLVIIDFNKEFAGMSKDAFIEDILVKKLNASNIVVGYNYHFGKGASGNSSDLVESSIRFGFNPVIIPAYKIGHKVVSSSHIRNFITEGRIKEANEFLGRLYYLEGKVVKGHGVGRKIGFPTANLLVDTDKLLPKPGVYSIIADVKGSEYAGFCNVGFQPTFNEREKQLVVEVNLFDFDADIYDEIIGVYFIDYLRDVQKFSSVDALIEELKIDKIKAIESVAKNIVIKY